MQQQIAQIGEILATVNENGVPYLVSDRDLFMEYRDMLHDYSANVSAVANDVPEQPMMKFVLSRIDKIIAFNDSFQDSILLFANWNVNESPMGGEGDAARAKAISESIKARETTNQQLIAFLNTMYDNLIKGDASNLQ